MATLKYVGYPPPPTAEASEETQRPRGEECLQITQPIETVFHFSSLESSCFPIHLTPTHWMHLNGSGRYHVPSVQITLGGPVGGTLTDVVSEVDQRMDEIRQELHGR